MAIGTPVTLLDFAKRSDPDGKIAKIVEIQSKINPILNDIPYVEGNLPTGHLTTVRSGLPDITWRKLGYGVQPNKSTTVQITDTCGMMEAYAEVDKRLADLNGNTAEFRLSENMAYMESMAQTHTTALFYGDQTINPERITGLTPRFNSLSGAENSSQIINAGGTGSVCTSIWLVGWGVDTVHGIFPKGSQAGWIMEDKGQVTVENFGGTGLRGECYRTWYRQDTGLTVRDWRYVSRVVNINMTDMATVGDTTDSAPNILKLMQRCLGRLWNKDRCKPVFYVSRAMETYLQIALMNKSNVWLSMGDYTNNGAPELRFMGIPVRRCDSILDTETAIS